MDGEVDGEWHGKGNTGLRRTAHDDDMIDRLCLPGLGYTPVTGASSLWRGCIHFILSSFGPAVYLISALGGFLSVLFRRRDGRAPHSTACGFHGIIAFWFPLLILVQWAFFRWFSRIYIISVFLILGRGLNEIGYEALGITR